MYNIVMQLANHNVQPNIGISQQPILFESLQPRKLSNVKYRRRWLSAG